MFPKYYIFSILRSIYLCFMFCCLFLILTSFSKEDLKSNIILNSEDEDCRLLQKNKYQDVDQLYSFERFLSRIILKTSIQEYEIDNSIESEKKVEDLDNNSNSSCEGTHNNGAGRHNHGKSLNLLYTGPSGTYITQFEESEETIVFESSKSQKYGLSSDCTYPFDSVDLHTSCSQNDTEIGVFFDPFEIMGISIANGCSEDTFNSPSNLSNNATCICQLGIYSVTFIYNGPTVIGGGAYDYHDNELGYWSNLIPGQSYSFDISNTNHTHWHYHNNPIFWTYQNGGWVNHGTMDSSCGTDVLGNIYGPFTITGWTDLQGNQCPSNVICDNITDGGLISGDETNCDPFDPITIINLEEASGNSNPGSGNNGGNNGSGCCNGTHSNGAGGHNHVKSLNLQYSGPSGNVNLYTNDGSGGTGVTNITQFVQNGETVIFEAAGSQKYGSNSAWNYPGGSVNLHTSCSQAEVVIGATFGPFQILGITTANGCTEGDFGNPTSDPIEYQWIKSIVGCPANINQAIQGATGLTYNPPSITETTWYVRLARRELCEENGVGDPQGWIPSNCVVKIVEGCGIPIFSNLPADKTIECTEDESSSNTGIATGSDTCGSVVITESDTVFDNCGNTKVITRTWTATGTCGNQNSAVQTITVQDTFVPTITAPADVTIECTEDESSSNTGIATGSDTCGSVVISESETVVNNCGFTKVITRTWTATDACGNQSSVVQTITVQDNEAPVLIGVPADVTAECDNITSVAANITVTDNCSTNVTIDFIETNVPGACINAYTIIRTWIATDDCGNTESVSQNIAVEDNTPPTLIDVPANTEVECSSIPEAPYVGAIDNCDYDVVAILTEVETPLNCGYLIIRTWTATDACGNKSTATQEVIVTDSEAPSLWEIPADIQTECGNIPPIDLNVGVLDNCDPNATLDFVETYTPGFCIDNYTIIRTWTATDNCGNSVSDSQYISVVDTQDPVLIGIPANVTIECSAIPLPAIPIANDNCDTDVDILFQENITPGACIGNYTITRIWIATDNCGNTVEGIQEIIVEDTTKPIISGVLADVDVECDDIPSAQAAGTIIVSDNCDTNVDLTFSEIIYPGSCIDSYTIKRIWTATDNCENITVVTQNITVSDVTPPILIGVPVDIQVDCNNVPSAPAAGSIIATDNCDINVVIQYQEELIYGDCDGSYVLKRTWKATDNCGNETSATQLVTVGDIYSPVLIGVPDDIVVECNNVPDQANPTAIDNCDMDVIISFSETYYPGTCPNSTIIIRSWTATDNCGNETNDSQTIIVDDIEAPILIGIPADEIASCDSIPLVAGNITVTDNCSVNISIDYSELTSPLACGYLIIRTWTATDDCGNMASESQNITIVDDTTPTLIGVPSNITVECSSIPSAPYVEVTDNCDFNVIAVLSEFETPLACGYLITRTWTATDSCGNTISDSQYITVKDTQSPILEGIPTDLTIDCNNIPTPTQPIATDNCDPDVLISFYEINTQGTCSNSYTLTRVWTATDNCGNTTESVQTIIVQDVIEPMLIDVPNNLTIDLTQGQTIPTPPVLIGTDNCDMDVEITFEENQLGSGCSYTIERIWTATDNCDNKVSETQLIEVLEELNVVETHTDAYCGENNGSIDLTVLNGVLPISFVWSNGVGNIEDQSNLAPGIYEVTVTAGVGCVANLFIEILGSGSLESDISATMLNCFGGNDGSINVTMLNGLAPFTYDWTGGIGNTSNPTNLTAGFYNVTITDANGCTVSTAASVNQPQELTLSILSDDSGCPSGSGSATANIVGGMMPYQYFWSNGETISTINNLDVGTYTVIVTDNNGCTIEDEVVIISSSDLAVSIDKTDVSCNQNTDGIATANVIGGQPSYTYLWSNGESNATIINLEAGIYTVTVTDGNGCFETQTIQIISPPELQSVTVSTMVTPIGNDGLATVTATGGSIPYQYIWSNGQMTQTASGLSVGNYTVTVIDDNGCFEVAEVEITASSLNGEVNIGDYVWFDTDRDGIQDSDELGFNNVTVNLLTSGQDGTFGTLDDEIIATETTSNNPFLMSSGYYLFENVGGGTYQIEFVLSSLPNDYIITSPNYGIDDEVDSDASPLTGRTSTFTIVTGQMDDLSFDVGVHPECDNVNTGGAIGETQTICEGEIPDLLNNSIYPTGGTGDLEYVWLTNTTGSPFSNIDPTWTIIQGATNEYYQPGQINTNTYFVRCARRMGCLYYTGESNIISILVTPLPSAEIVQAPTSLCSSDSTSFHAAHAGATATYFWDFGIGALPQNSTQRNVYDLIYSSAGIKTVTLTVENMGCSISTTYEFEVTNCFNGFVFTSFSVEPEPSGTEVLINWTTQYEVNDSRFFLEHAKNGDEFQTYEVRNANGSAQQNNSYFALDADPYYGVNYYRIKYVDASGQVFYSEVEVVIFDHGSRDINVYPNPIIDDIYIEFLTELKNDATIEVVDLTGRIIHTQSVSEGFSTYKVSLGDYPAGTYLVWVRYNNYRKDVERVFKLTD